MQNSPLVVAHCPPWMDTEARQDMLQAIAALDCRGLVVPEDVHIQVVHAMPEIAAAAYQVYRSAFPEAEVLMPEFAELPTLVKDAWEAVAAKILTYAPAIATHPESAAHPQETPQ